MASSTSRLERVGGCTTLAESLNATTREAHVRRLVGHELPRRLLGRGHAGRREVLRLHARRHVEGEDDRPLPPRQVDGGLRAGERDEQHDDAEQERRPARRAAASPTACPRASCAGHGAERRPRRPRGAAPSTGSRPRAPARAAARAARPGSSNVTGALVACAWSPCGAARVRGRRRSRGRSGRRRRGGSRCAAARRAPRPPRRSGGGTPGSLVSTTSCSPVSASCSTTTPASTRPTSRLSQMRSATTSWRCASIPSARSHPGSLMKSESTNTSERRRMVESPARNRPAEIGRRARPGSAAGAGRGRARSTCMRPPRGSTTRSIVLSYSTAPMRLPSRVSSRPMVVAISTITVSLVRST